MVEVLYNAINRFQQIEDKHITIKPILQYFLSLI